MEINPYNVAVGGGGRYYRYGKFGFNPDVGTTEESIWDLGGIYDYLSSAQTLTISSDDANDTSAGTGARTVTIFGYDSNFAAIKESVTLNGQTPVSTSGEFIRVFRMVVNSAGSGGENAGKIYAGTGTVTAGVPANPYAAITEGRNQTLMCVWTVPGNKNAYMTSVFVSSQNSSNATVQIRLVARPENEVFQTKYEFIVTQAGGPIWAPFNIPNKFTSKTDIEIRAISSVGASDVSAALEFMVGT